MRAGAAVGRQDGGATSGVAWRGGVRAGAAVAAKMAALQVAARWVFVSLV
ncbi:MAG TPA: hypothetical protein VH599_09270 [Ktedonobacterales bacterium]